MERVKRITGTRDRQTGLKLCESCEWSESEGFRITMVSGLSSWTKEQREELYPTLGDW